MTVTVGPLPDGSTLLWDPYSVSLPEEFYSGVIPPSLWRSSSRLTVKNTQARAADQKQATVAAEDRPLGPAYGNVWVPGKVDIFRQVGSSIYIRALLGIGPWHSIDQVSINESTYITGDFNESDPSYIGVWGTATTPPVTINAGDVYQENGLYYECIETFTATADTGCYTPSGSCYSSYFKQILENINSNTYTGTTTQGIDPILAGVISGYNETLVLTEYGETFGIAYITIELPLEDYAGGFPRVNAKVRGQKVGTTPTYSDNPARCRADFLSSKVYGAGLICDSTSLETAADYCDALVNGEARSSINLEFGTIPQDVGAWDAVLREYAYCWTYLDDGIVYFVPDDARSLDHDLASANKVYSPLALPAIQFLADTERPNSVRVKYTTFVGGAAKSSQTDKAKTSAAVAGTEDERFSEFSMPGFTSLTQAETYRDFKLAQAANERFRMSFEISHYGIQINPGELVSIPYCGGNSKTLRVLSRTMIGPGHYRIDGQHYSAEVYA